MAAKKAHTITLDKAVTNEIFTTLKKGDEVNISLVGKIKRTKLPKRKGFNPNTGQHEVFPPAYRVVFNPSKTLKRVINKTKPKKK